MTVHEDDLRTVLLTALDGNVKGSGAGNWAWRVNRRGGQEPVDTVVKGDMAEELLIDFALASGVSAELRLDTTAPQHVWVARPSPLSKWRTLSIERGLRTAPSDWLFGVLNGSQDDFPEAFKFLQYCLYGEVLYA